MDGDVSTSGDLLLGKLAWPAFLHLLYYISAIIVTSIILQNIIIAIDSPFSHLRVRGDQGMIMKEKVQLPL